MTSGVLRQGETTRGARVLTVERLSKTFVGTRALREASLDVESGEIHALVGANGSGKSTLIKIITGVEVGDPGGLIGAAEESIPADAVTPGFAAESGIRVVHQERALFPDMTVTENISLGSGFETDPSGRIRWRRNKASTSAAIERLDIAAKPDTLVEDLRPAAWTMVAVARALQEQTDDSAPLLLLDEPTAALPQAEVELLFESLRRRAAQGSGVLIVTHDLTEALEIADRITVMRDGQTVATVKASEATREQLVQYMFAETLDDLPQASATPRKGADADDYVLVAEGIRGRTLRGVDIALRRGEIVGLGGLVGSGVEELLEILFADRKAESGEVFVDGERQRFKSPADATRAGFAYIGPDRATEGIFPGMTVTENLTLGDMSPFFRRWRLSGRRMRKFARGAIQDFAIRSSGVDVLIDSLSGGNQQKVLVARALTTGPKVVLLSDPTVGVDVRSRGQISQILREATEGGTSALMSSSDIGELAQLCDRVVVLRNGLVAGELEGKRTTERRIAELVHGADGS